MTNDVNTQVSIPRALRPMWPAAKMLWLYLDLKGAMTASQRELSVQLGLTQRAIAENLTKLADAGLLRYEPGSDRSAKSSIKAIDSIFDPVENPLPPAMKEADTSTKLLYLWLLPQGDVTYTHKEVAANLGITEVTAVKARQGLEQYGAITYTRRPAPRRHGIYRVLPPDQLQERLDIDTDLALPDEIAKGRGAELKLYWLIEQRGMVPAHQQTLASILDAPQSSISKAIASLTEKGLVERAERKGEEKLVLAGAKPRKRRASPEEVVPEILRGEANAVQLLYMWLRPQGEVRYSYSDLVELVRIRSHSVTKAIGRLEELGVLKVFEKPSPHRKGRFRIVEPDAEPE